MTTTTTDKGVGGHGGGGGVEGVWPWGAYTFMNRTYMFSCKKNRLCNATLWGSVIHE